MGCGDDVAGRTADEGIVAVSPLSGIVTLAMETGALELEIAAAPVRLATRPDKDTLASASILSATGNVGRLA